MTRAGLYRAALVQRYVTHILCDSVRTVSCVLVYMVLAYPHVSSNWELIT